MCFRGTKKSAISQAILKQTTLTPPYKSKIAEIIVHVKRLQFILEQFSSNLFTPAYKFETAEIYCNVNISKTRVRFYIGIRSEIQVLQRNREFCHFSGNSQATHLTPPCKSKTEEIIVHVNICN